MFIVSRKSKESVIIDGFNNPQRELKVTVLEIKGRRVKLAFEVKADSLVHCEPSWNRFIKNVESNYAAEGREASDA